MPLLEARKQYKPFEYPWAFDFGSASSRSTGCPRKCRWARIAATGRRS